MIDHQSFKVGCFKDNSILISKLESLLHRKKCKECFEVPFNMFDKTTEFLKELFIFFIDNKQGGKKPLLLILCLNYVLVMS